MRSRFALGLGPVLGVRCGRRRRDEAGLSAAVSLVGVAISLLLVALLLVVSLGGFGSSSGGNPHPAGSIFGQSHAEQQLKLCAEGRASTYGNPPTQAQQATCLRQLAGQAGAAGGLP